MQFGTNLKKYRKLRKLSQTGLSKKTGIPQTTLSDLETGKTSPNLKHLKILCESLEISVIELLDKIL
ncbi:MAG: helix-turn-helix domain-containing protein [Tissierellales bacterium]|jgi:transcriptional regulator with XRE-family HTH domain|nr:helix-turn-helix domain-containing protein [Tissierellales bacterium]